MEQRGLDHCIVIKGIREMAKKEEKDCIELVYEAITNTIDAENEVEHKQSARNMEIRQAKWIGK